MSFIFLLLKAWRQVDFGGFDLPIFMVLVDLDCLVLLRLWWTIRRG